MVSLCLLCFERNLLQGYALNYAHNFAENKLFIAFYTCTTKTTQFYALKKPKFMQEHILF